MKIFLASVLLILGLNSCSSIKDKTPNLDLRKDCTSVKENKTLADIFCKKKQHKMKKIYIIILILFTFSSVKAAEKNCDTAMNKVDPACSKILKKGGSAMGNLFKSIKKFSSKHQTIDQTVTGVKKSMDK